MKTLKKHRSSAVLATAGMLALTACGEVGGGDAEGGSAPATGESELAFATLSQGTAWYSHGISVGNTIADQAEDITNVEVLTYAGGIGNPELVAEGEVDLAFSFNTFTGWAYEGRENTPFEGEAHDNLRVLVGGLDEYWFGPIASADFEADTLDQVIEGEIGVDMMSLPAGTAEEALTPMVLEAHGSSLEEVESWGGSIEHTSPDVSSNAIRDGQADLWFQSLTDGHPAVTELAQTNDVKFLSVSEEARDYLEEFGLASEVLPAGTFNGQDEEVPLVGWSTGIIVSEEMDDETAYAITEAIIENAESLTSANAGMSAFDPESAFSEEINGDVPLHPGAEAYYRDAGLMD